MLGEEPRDSRLGRQRRQMATAVTMRLIVLIAALFSLSAFTQAELDTAKNAKEFFKDSYWKCLATEIVRVVPTNMSVQEFSLFAKGGCRKEQRVFCFTF
jgi:hypothetical protein